MTVVRAPLTGTLRKDGRWRIVITLTKADGSKIKKAIHAPTQRECQQKAREELGKDERRTYREPRTIIQAWESWEKEGWERLSDGSKRQHSWAKARIIREFGESDVRQIESGRVLRWLRKLLTDATLSGNSPKHLKASLSSLLSYCQECGWIESNAARDVRMPIGGRKNPTRHRITEDGFKKLLDSEPDAELRDFWWTLGESGLRPIEARRLTSEDLPYALDMWWIHVKASKTKAGENRDVPISDALAHRLTSREGLLFPRLAGRGHIGYRQIVRRWHEALSRAELPDTNLYQLRKLAISRWVANGVPPDAVKALAGHSTIRITMDHYNRIGKEKLTQAAYAGVVDK